MIKTLLTFRAADDLVHILQPEQPLPSTETEEEEEETQDRQNEAADIKEREEDEEERVVVEVEEDTATVFPQREREKVKSPQVVGVERLVEVKDGNVVVGSVQCTQYRTKVQKSCIYRRWFLYRLIP